MKSFETVKKNFGFGCMRLPLLPNGDVDLAVFCNMVDEFMKADFNYFDTAHVYISGKSELALKECLVKRYARDRFVLANKLSANCFNSEADIRPFFDKQLAACGVDYFDFYLMHAQNAVRYKKYCSCRAYELAYELKQEGKIKYLGLSFHDKAEVLEKILSEQPNVDFVQIQFNYLDYDDESIESKKCYDVCKKFNKPVIVMEPVKGGSLIDLPSEAQQIFDSLKGGSNASYAIRFAASFENIFMVLSGMSNIQQVKDNISFMKEFHPLSENEFNAIKRLREILKKQDTIPCTACRYCVDGCPKNIPIPEIISCINSEKRYGKGGVYYYILTQEKGKASTCISCGKCESACPQNIKIRSAMKSAVELFEK